MRCDNGLCKADFGWYRLLAVFLVVSLAPDAGGEQPTMITGRMLSVVESAPDEVLHFYLSSKPVAGEDAPGEFISETTSLLFQDTFDGLPNPRWQDVTGVTRIESGKLVASAERNVIVLGDTVESDVRISVEATLAAVVGIVVHYRDRQNYVLAFVTPAFNLTGYHEVVDGNFGPWIESVSTASLVGPTVSMTVRVRGLHVTTVVADAHGHSVRTRCQLAKLREPGSVGLYYDRSSQSPQCFDNFRVDRLQRRYPADAVEVVIPRQAAIEDRLWRLGPIVRVTGTESVTSSGRRTVTVASLNDIVAVEPLPKTLFPTQVPRDSSCDFQPQVIRAPACGVVYRQQDLVTNGMPLGGVNTGCLDMETSGMLGYMTLFNTHVPRRGPLNVPYLGLSVGGTTWVLCDPQAKDGAGQYQPSATGRSGTLWRNGGYEQVTTPLVPVPLDVTLSGVRTADEIHYWGHYPIADLEFDTDAPVQVGLRAWRPFCRAIW